jgi:hypothetical protein
MHLQAAFDGDRSQGNQRPYKGIKLRSAKHQVIVEMKGWDRNASHELYSGRELAQGFHASLASLTPADSNVAISL